ncbi:hypothetical protein KC363_g81 [Hortaea werneckii]|nr:hypothetical protein KC363_g81 [Hortaea werneckii]
MTFASVLAFLALNVFFIILAGVVLAFVMIAKNPTESEETNYDEYDSNIRGQDLETYLQRFVQKPHGMSFTKVFAIACGFVWIINLWNMVLIKIVPSFNMRFNAMDTYLAAMLPPAFGLLEAAVLATSESMIGTGDLAAVWQPWELTSHHLGDAIDSRKSGRAKSSLTDYFGPCDEDCGGFRLRRSLACVCPAHLSNLMPLLVRQSRQQYDDLERRKLGQACNHGDDLNGHHAQVLTIDDCYIVAIITASYILWRLEAGSGSREMIA